MFQSVFKIPATFFSLKTWRRRVEIDWILNFKCDYLTTIKYELRGSKKKRQRCVRKIWNFFSGWTEKNRSIRKSRNRSILIKNKCTNDESDLPKNPRNRKRTKPEVVRTITTTTGNSLRKLWHRLTMPRRKWFSNFSSNISFRSRFHNGNFCQKASPFYRRKNSFTCK